MSSNPESSKTLAAIGALLMFISAVPVLGIVGIILLFIGLKGLSEYYKEPDIYNDALKGLIYGIIGLVAVSVLMLGGIFGIFTLGLAGAIGGLILIIAALVIAFIFYLLMAMRFRRVFDKLAERSGEHLFHTSATLLYWGAILTIVFVGLILVWISFLILAIAFFSMKLAPATAGAQSYGYAPPPPTSTSTAQRYCPHCGAPADQNAAFCPNCGKQL